MKKTQAIIFLVAVAIILWAGISGAADTSDEVFSQASFKGRYAIEFIGIDAVSGQVAGTGIIRSNGDGTLTGIIAIKDGANACTDSLTGTYSVSADGMGTATFTVAGSDPSSPPCGNAIGSSLGFTFVLDGRGENRQIKFSATTPQFTLMGLGDAR